MQTRKSSDSPELTPRRAPTLMERTVALIRGRFSGGLLIVAPFVLTYLIFRWLYDTASGVLEPVIVEVFGRDIPGLSVALLFLVTFAIGWAAINFLGQRLLYTLQAGVIRVPVIGPTFSIVKQLIATLGPGSGTGFSRVVEIEYPRKGMWAIGFLTAVTEHDDGHKMGMVYVPTAPTPSSGWLAILPLEDIYHVDMTANQALSMTISAGIASPARIKRDTDHPASWNPDRDPGAPKNGPPGSSP